jgi:ubiquitin-protein ligase
VYPDGKICLNIIQEAPYGAWRANLTIHQILLGIQVRGWRGRAWTRRGGRLG